MSGQLLLVPLASEDVMPDRGVDEYHHTGCKANAWHTVRAARSRHVGARRGNIDMWLSPNLNRPPARCRACFGTVENFVAEVYHADLRFA